MKQMGRFKLFFLSAFTWLALISFVALLVHVSMEHRQAQRELIYVKAQQMAAQQKRQDWLDYQKRLKERQLRQQYMQRGRVQNTRRAK